MAGKHTTITLEIEDEASLTVVIELADPHDGTELLDLQDIFINGHKIKAPIEEGTDVLSAISDLQDAVTAALRADTNPPSQSTPKKEE